MKDIVVSPDLWTASIMPEGLIEIWLVPDGAQVRAGDALAIVLIEDARHDLLAPSTGRLTVSRAGNSVIEPGAIIGQVSP